jgi:hypothetical protein
MILAKSSSMGRLNSLPKVDEQKGEDDNKIKFIGKILPFTDKKEFSEKKVTQP